MRNGAEFNTDGFGDEDGYGGNGNAIEEIIDEEELMFLKEMKDLKKNYRDNYDKLKNLKLEVNDIQANIDNLKQQLIGNFETWYAEEFDVGAGGNYAGDLQLDESSYN